LYWDFKTPTSDIANYFPVPVLMLRTLKAEVMSGMTEEKLELVKGVPDWLASGKYGVVCFVPK
jgi:hypothetical protein